MNCNICRKRDPTGSLFEEASDDQQLLVFIISYIIFFYIKTILFLTPVSFPSGKTDRTDRLYVKPVCPVEKANKDSRYS